MTKLRISLPLATGSIDIPVLSSPSVPASVVIALVSPAFARLVSAAQMLASTDARLMLGDAPPPTGSLLDVPPVQSFHRHDLVALRAVMDAGWTVAAQRLAWLQGATW